MEIWGNIYKILSLTKTGDEKTSINYNSLWLKDKIWALRFVSIVIHNKSMCNILCVCNQFQVQLQPFHDKRKAALLFFFLVLALCGFPLFCSFGAVKWSFFCSRQSTAVRQKQAGYLLRVVTVACFLEDKRSGIKSERGFASLCVSGIQYSTYL